MPCIILIAYSILRGSLGDVFEVYTKGNVRGFFRVQGVLTIPAADWLAGCIMQKPDNPGHPLPDPPERNGPVLRHGKRKESSAALPQATTGLPMAKNRMNAKDRPIIILVFFIFFPPVLNGIYLT
jgi:hypothetical protein